MVASFTTISCYGEICGISAPVNPAHVRYAGDLVLGICTELFPLKMCSPFLAFSRRLLLVFGFMQRHGQSRDLFCRILGVFDAIT
jgi:hypothetical protein